MDKSTRGDRRRVLASFSEPGAVMTVVASLALPIPALSALNKYAIQYPLDRLHYAMFQLLLLVLVPLLVIAMHWPGDKYRLEVARYDSPSQAAQPKRQPKPAQHSTTSQGNM
ncbi:hypothetical protein H4S08_000750 [Coemansia sp. RSA 1365]|nr:hypothetical protein H4S08_000750 [Coemansia sp. RSA 1365]